MPTRGTEERLADDVQLWVADGLISTETALVLRQRYNAPGFGLATLVKYLGISGGLFAFLGIVGFVTALSGNKGFAAFVLTLVGGAGLFWGLRLARDAQDRYALSSKVVTATAALAYALPNRLILIQALLNAFVAFGGETGYDSGWGAYWLGMNYPARFVLVGLATLGLAGLHARFLKGARQGFARVYLHHGILVANLALWFFALFGRHDLEWHDNGGERALFSLLWAGTSITSLLLGSRYGWRLARGYGLTFLIINLYTFYFQFVAANSPDAWFLHLLVVGVSLVGVGFGLERHLSRKRGAV